MNKKLFLIGNGFDIAHGFKTRYLDLMSWIYENDSDTIVDFNKLLLRNFMARNGYFYEDDWRYKRPTNAIDSRIENMDVSWVKSTIEYKFLKEDFEDYEALFLYALWESLEENMHYVFLDEEYSDAITEIQSLIETLEAEEFGQVIDADIDIIYRPAQEYYNKLTRLADFFKDDLLQWVYDVNETIYLMEDYITFYEAEDCGNTINMLEDDFFGDDDYIINFNYSKTIEQLYSKEVCHIHGQDSTRNPPIMGHTKDFSEMYQYDEEEMILVEEFYKDFDRILELNSSYFEKIQDVNEIVVLGLGYHNTDYPYFKKINSIIPNVKWCLYYFSNDDHKRAQGYVEKLNIKDENVKFISLKSETPYTKIIRYELEDDEDDN